MPAIRVVDRIQDQADFGGILEDGKILKYDQSSDKFLLVPQSYIHYQLQASDTWTIIHNLDKFPSVSVVDSAGTLVYGEIEYLNNTTVIARFSSSFGGQAYIN